MKAKETIIFGILFIVASNPLCAYGKLPEGAVHYYEKTREKNKVFQYQLDHTTRFMLMGDSCRELESFKDLFLKWSRKISPNTIATSIAPRCECEGHICGIELTDLFPQPFKERIQQSSRCYGPNCFNTALISAGFLSPKQSRYSTVDEFEFFLNQQCEEIPTEERETNHIIVFYKENEAESPIHAAIYIGHNILFEKAGELREDPYQLVDWSSHEAQGTLIRAFRRKGIPDQGSRYRPYNPIRVLEEKFGELVDSKSTEEYIDLQLETLYKEHAKVLNEYVHRQPLSPNLHALVGLARSLASIKHPKEKYYGIELKEGHLISVPGSKIQFFKRPDAYHRVTVPSDLSENDSIQILAGEWAIEQGFEKNRFYRVVRIPKNFPHEKYYEVELREGRRIIVPGHRIQFFKRPDAYHRATVPSDLSENDSILILESNWAIEQGFEKNRFYRVVRTP